MTHQVPEKLLTAVQGAINKMAMPGIEGWGMERVPSALHDYGQLVVTSPTTGCTDSTCNHVSHGPAAPTYKWVPNPGSLLIKLGEEEIEGETLLTYYALLVNNQVIYLEKEEPRFHWAALYVIDEDEVPTWALARLAQYTAS